MATVGCECPLGVSGTKHVHVPTCPNRKRGKGTQPREYSGKARVTRSYSHARLAVEHLRNVLLKLAGAMPVGDWPGFADMRLDIADCRTQCETVRRYLDGE